MTSWQESVGTSEAASPPVILARFAIYQASSCAKSGIFGIAEDYSTNTDEIICLFSVPLTVFNPILVTDGSLGVIYTLMKCPDYRKFNKENQSL